MFQGKPTIEYEDVEIMYAGLEHYSKMPYNEDGGLKQWLITQSIRKTSWLCLKAFAPYRRYVDQLIAELEEEYGPDEGVPSPKDRLRTIKTLKHIIEFHENVAHMFELSEELQQRVTNIKKIVSYLESEQGRNEQFQYDQEFKNIVGDPNAG